MKQFVVFNIGGNKFRLVAFIDYRRERVYVRQVLTHKEYDKGRWKKDPFGLENGQKEKDGE